MGPIQAQGKGHEQGGENATAAAALVSLLLQLLSLNDGPALNMQIMETVYTLTQAILPECLPCT